jgi:hypothetical protein
VADTIRESNEGAIHKPSLLVMSISKLFDCRARHLHAVLHYGISGLGLLTGSS